MDDLTPPQREAFNNLLAITNGENPESELTILRSCDWNVQRAAELIFDESAATQHPSSTSTTTPLIPPKLEGNFADDHDALPPRHSRTAPAYPLIPRLGRGVFSIVTFPITLSFSLVSHLFHFVFRILRIPIPRYWLGGSSTGGIRRPLQPRDPASVADRFVRELEEETGAVCVSRAAATRSTDGPPEKTPETSRKLLPDFWIGSYEDALKAAQRDLKVLCVMLLSEEHDNNMEFRRTVMTNPELVDALTENGFIVWAGDIRDREAYSTATKLGATTYPFVAFVSLFNRSPRSTSSSSSSPQLTVLSRHEGSPHDTTSAASLHTQITTVIIPRISPFLTRLRTERAIREQERQLREEQDRAFREAERRDGERVRARMREEEERKRKEAEKTRAAEAKRELEEKKMLWRRWARRNLVPPEDPTAPSIRLRITLPDGRRTIRTFSPKDQVEGLFAFVDSHFIPEEHSPSQDPETPPEGLEYDWGFKIITSYPRVQLHCLKGQEIGDVTMIKGGASLNVEMLATEDSGSGSEWEEE